MACYSDSFTFSEINSKKLKIIRSTKESAANTESNILYRVGGTC
jgi:hypothetical protein